MEKYVSRMPIRSLEIRSTNGFTVLPNGGDEEIRMPRLDISTYVSTYDNIHIYKNPSKERQLRELSKA
jgi:hypothetical protein